jgi:hypothetical protein
MYPCQNAERGEMERDGPDGEGFAIQGDEEIGTLARLQVRSLEA